MFCDDDNIVTMAMAVRGSLVGVCSILLLAILGHAGHAVSIETVVIESRMCNYRQYLVDEKGVILIFNEKFHVNLSGKKCEISFRYPELNSVSIAVYVDELYIPDSSDCRKRDQNYINIRSTTGKNQSLCGKWPEKVLNGVAYGDNLSTDPVLVTQQGSVTLSTENSFDQYYARIRLEPEGGVKAPGLGGGAIAGIVIGVLVAVVILVGVVLKLFWKKGA